MSETEVRIETLPAYNIHAWLFGSRFVRLFIYKKEKRIGANPEEGLDSSFCYVLSTPIT